MTVNFFLLLFFAGAKGLHRWLCRMGYVANNYVLERKRLLETSASLPLVDEKTEVSLKYKYNRCVRKVKFPRLIYKPMV